jgi:hypothetical protein
MSNAEISIRTRRHRRTGCAEGPACRRGVVPAWSVVVPVAVVARVPMPVMNVVGVVAMRDRDVTALLAVLMGVALMRHMAALRAFVGVVAMDPVKMPVMRVVGVVAMRDRDVTTALTVGMLMTWVSGVQSRIRHRTGPSCRQPHLSSGTYNHISI